MNENIILKEDIVFNTFYDKSNKYYILSNSENRNWKISKFTYDIIEEFRKSNTQINAKKNLEKKYGCDIDEEKISTTVDFLKKNGLIQNYESSTAKKKDKMLWLRITLIPKRIVELFSFLTVLFKKESMIIFILLELIWYVYIFSSNSLLQTTTEFLNYDIGKFILSVLIIVLFGLIHELGHMAALMSFKEKPGNIGCGFYMYMPVFFSDVTNTWRLKKNQRICVDIGGIYLQQIAIILFYFVNVYIVKSDLLTTTIVLMTTQTASNLLPFVRMDGYWVLCDYLGSTNLYTTVTTYIKSIIKKDKVSDEISYMKKRQKLVLLAYTVAMGFFMFSFIKMLIRASKISTVQLRHDIVTLLTSGFSKINTGNVIDIIQDRFSKYIMLIFLLRFVISILLKVKKLLIKSKNSNNNKALENN